jgi:hypothetical protein
MLASQGSSLLSDSSSFTALTWNIEGLNRNIYNLKHYVDLHLPDLIFLSEPQVFSHDLSRVIKPLAENYLAFLNTADRFDPELPMVKSRANGGTLVLWRRRHDPHVSVWPVSSPAFLPIIFQPPGHQLSIHIAVYLPTSGQETQFMEELSKLCNCVEELADAHPDAPIYLRGDFNVRCSHTKRIDVLAHFTAQFDLLEVPLPHPTYHHFLGNGQSDSFLDKLFFSRSLPKGELLVTIYCKLADPFIESHHDMIISNWFLPVMTTTPTMTENIVAPKVKNDRVKVLWSDEGIEEYQRLVLPHLSRLQELWLPSPSRSSSSLLLDSTNNLLASCASLSNRTIALDGSQPCQQKSKTPKAVKLSQNKLLKQSKMIKRAVAENSFDIRRLKDEYNRARILHRKLEREHKAGQSSRRDEILYSVCSKDPSPIFKGIRSSKRTTAAKISKLTVGDKMYLGDNVKDGFFDSISQLKSRDSESLSASPTFSNFSALFSNILEVCKHGPLIPPISESESFRLIQRMKQTVNDVFGITVNHYAYAGPSGWKHFNLLLNILLSDINNTTIEEVNTVHACILFKGHKKDKTSDRSYRTISSCPIVAKALDLYIRDLHIDDWNLNQAESQFQGEGSCHELAAVLLTETIQHSLFSLKLPIFILYLDAQSAFDVVLRELLIKNLYFSCNTNGHSIHYINNRLGYRRTFIDWEGNLMGPIDDEAGLEQGGVSSSDFYKIYGKEQLTTAQDSSLGVKIGNETISGIGLADDTALLSNDIHKLNLLLKLTEEFCKRFHVKLCASKTKLQVYHTMDMQILVNYAMETNPLHIDGKKINFASTAEHVGLLRSSAGNHLTLLDRITAHNKALGAVLHTGMARGHRGNPAASLHVEKMYGAPVYLSGLPALVLSKPEQSMISQHSKETMSNLQRLLPCTPRSVVCFLGGDLPGEALLHTRQLTLFGMLSRLPDNILNKVAASLLRSPLSTKSWFHQIRSLCARYLLPDPLHLLDDPLPKAAFKLIVKKQVLNYWEEILRSEAENPRYSSLGFFKPRYMSLSSPHPLWTTAGSSPAKVSMATVQAQMISGRYRSESLCRHWSKNKQGFCLLSPGCSTTVEDLPHILKHCSGLAPVREKLVSFTIKHCKSVPAAISELVLTFTNPTNPMFCQFLLDCSCLPEVIGAVQLHGHAVLHHLFSITRAWVYSLHKARMKLLGRWNVLL